MSRPLWGHEGWTALLGARRTSFLSPGTIRPTPFHYSKHRGQLAAIVWAEDHLSTMQPGDTPGSELPTAFIHPFPDKSCPSACGLHAPVLWAPTLVAFSAPRSRKESCASSDRVRRVVQVCINGANITDAMAERALGTNNADLLAPSPPLLPLPPGFSPLGPHGKQGGVQHYYMLL